MGSVEVGSVEVGSIEVRSIEVGICSTSLYVHSTIRVVEHLNVSGKCRSGKCRSGNSSDQSVGPFNYQSG